MSSVVVDAGTYQFLVDRAFLDAAIGDIADELMRERLAEGLADLKDDGIWRLSQGDADVVLDAVSRREREEKA